MMLYLLIFIIGVYSEADLLKEMGIETYKLDLDEKPNTNQNQVKVNSIEDLPKLIEAGTYTQDVGMQLIKKFLTDDDESLKQIGAVYDQTGFDGLDQSEEIAPQGQQQRIEQRAKSASLIFIKQNDPSSDYEVYGVQNDTEVVQDWKTFLILMMNSMGKHRLLKVCILEKETNGYLSYGMDQHDTCANKVETFKDLQLRAARYFKESGFDKFGNSSNKIKEPPINQDKKNKTIDKIEIKKSSEQSQNQIENTEIKKEEEPKPQDQTQQKPDSQEQKNQAEKLEQIFPKQNEEETLKESNKSLQDMVKQLIGEVQSLKTQVNQQQQQQQIYNQKGLNPPNNDKNKKTNNIRQK